MLLSIDDYIRFTWIHSIQNIIDVSSTFLNFQALVERQFSQNRKAFHLYWRGEYKKFHKYFIQNGIDHHIACSYTHDQNRNLNVKLDIWSIQAWLKWNVFLINNWPSPTLNNFSPFSKLFQKEPDYLALKPFSCAIFSLLHPYNKCKLSFCTSSYVYLGQSPHRYLDPSNGYVLILPMVIFS